MQPEEQPETLRELSEDALAALAPLDVDCGPPQRAEQGYRVHTGMIKLSWSFLSVKAKIGLLSDPEERARAKAARRYLLDCGD